MVDKHLRVCLCVLTGGCGAATPAIRPIPPPTTADIADAMRDSAAGWYAYPSDGTPRGDSARRFAALGQWDIEGGDRERGLRLLVAARKAGLADSMFLLDAALSFELMGRPYEALEFSSEAAERWPALVWAWRAKARALRKFGRHAEAADAQARADSLAPN